MHALLLIILKNCWKDSCCQQLSDCHSSNNCYHWGLLVLSSYRSIHEKIHSFLKSLYLLWKTYVVHLRPCCWSSSVTSYQWNHEYYSWRDFRSESHFSIHCFRLSHGFFDWFDRDDLWFQHLDLSMRYCSFAFARVEAVADEDGEHGCNPLLRLFLQFVSSNWIGAPYLLSLWMEDQSLAWQRHLIVHWHRWPLVHHCHEEMLSVEIYAF